MSVDTRLRILLGCLLLGVYLLVYTPRVDSADGQAILAVTAAALRHGTPEIGAIGAVDALLPVQMARMGAFGPDGALYSKKGVTPSLALAPLVLLAEALPWLETRAAAMLLNPLVTAATAMLLYTLARWLDYRPRTALATALLYGLATTALVYVKTLYGEPLAGLLLLGAVMAGHKALTPIPAASAKAARSPNSGAARIQPAGHDHARGWLAAAGVCLGLLVGVNLVYALTAPVLGAFLLVRPSAGTRHAVSPRQVIAFALPIAAALALLGAYNWARYGSPTNSGYHFASGEGFTQPALVGLYGLTVSPYRGIFWYSPALLLALPGWLMLRRRAPRLAWLALALVGLQLLAFASWWSWHGGIVWGPRFLIPVIPLAALMLAPLVEAAWTRRALAAVTAGFAALSAGVQILGAAYSVYHHTGYLYAHYYTGDAYALIAALSDEVLVNAGLSAILGHLALALTGWPLEPAWVAGGMDALHLLAVVGLAAVGLFACLVPMRARRAVSLSLLAAFAVLNIVAARQNRGGEYENIRALEAALQPPATVVVATTGFGESLLDLDGRWRTFSTNAPTQPDDPLAAPLWDYARKQGSRLWLLTWFSPADRANWQEQELWQTAAFVTERSAAGHRALLFDRSPVSADRDAGHRFGDIRLRRYGVTQQAGVLSVALDWSAENTLLLDGHWFVHLLDASGNILAQQDRAPLGGYLPPSAWTPGEIVTDRLAFLGDYPADVRLRIGWIDTASGQRLPAFDADGTAQADGYVVVSVR